MRLKTLQLNGFKSFAQKTVLEFESPIVAIVGPNGSGKSNVVEAVRFVLGEQSMKSMRGKGGSDLIFKGSKNLPKASRASGTVYFENKDNIFKLTNDSGEDINLNYETVSISREVYPDGINKYILNGSEVRLKDIHSLLASVHIGSSGHHIISQGEADRILSSSARDRKEMVEDALGLRIYQYKIKESERKLERTNENMKEVTLLRRENAPHLKFLEKQVEKFEKTKEMQTELSVFYGRYLKKESIYLEQEEINLSTEKSKLKNELDVVAGKISLTEDSTSVGGNKKIEELRIVEQKINSVRGNKNELERKLGRIEGILESRENKVKISGRCPLCGSEIKDSEAGQIEKQHNEEKELEELKISQANVLSEIQKLREEEEKLAENAEILKQDLNKEMEALRDLEREKFVFKVRQQELPSALELISIKEANLKNRRESFENELKEGAALVGADILSYKNFKIEEETEGDNQTQEELKKKIERIKIKLEDTGLGNGTELLREFKEVSDRDDFLAKEMEDLEKSIVSLQKLILDLKEKIDIEFKEGVKKINVEFQEFFSLMFGGGHGALSIVENKSPRRRSAEEAEIVREELDEIGEMENDKDIMIEQ